MKRLKRFTLIPLFAVFSTLFLVSCQFGKLYSPEPAENPVILTSQAQIKVVYGKHITWITEENPETDVVVDNITGPRWKVIENDWIKIKYSDIKPLEITVKENTSGNPRTYNLGMSNGPEEATLQIIQQ